jgi:type I restriction enzyme S subunit
VNDLLDLSGRANDLCRIPVSQSTQYARTIVKENDVLVSVVGTLGRAAVAPPSLVGANVARAVCSLRPRRNVESELLVAWTLTMPFKEQASLATGTDTAQPTLGMADLANFRLRWPLDLSEQRRGLARVVSITTEAEATRRALDRQNEVLAERRQALITAAVTGQFDVTTASGRA